MHDDIKVPVLPESVNDAVIAHIYKQPGETVAEDEVLIDLETDKVVLEVPAVHAGVVSAVHVARGDVVNEGDRLITIDSAPAAGAGDASGEASPGAASSPAAALPAMSPAVRKLVAEHDLDASRIEGSGKHGRILKQDVEAYLAARSDAGEERQSPSVASAPVSARSDAPTERFERRVPMTRLRATIAERLVQAQQTAAILTTFNEVNMQPVMDLRSRYQADFEKRFQVRLGFMSFFVQASVEALRRFPDINASIDGNDVVYHGYYDIGVAVSGPNGLVVPVLRDVDNLSVAQIEQAIVDYAQRARDNALTLDDIRGGTFTISNGGVFGSMLSTPIINPPQSAILGMHNIQQRAVVEDDRIVARPMMYLALSYDHRLIDGKTAVRFLATIKALLEDPARMLLGL